MSAILELADGIHPDVSAADYHARVPGVASNSVLGLFDRAPALYQAWLAGVDREETPALAFGTAFHCALLEPHVYETAYTVEPKFGDCRKTENKKRRDDWRAENTGRKLLEHADAIAIAGMVKAVHAHPLAGKMFAEGASELTLRWTDPETGIICKSRSDHYVARHGMCVDVKTTEDARADAFVKSVANFGYHRQNALYDDGFRAVGAPLDHFVFLAIEKRAPFLIGLFNLDDVAVAAGRRWARRTLGKFATCIERGEYPGYETSIQTLSLPGWAKDVAA